MSRRDRLQLYVKNLRGWWSGAPGGVRRAAWLLAVGLGVVTIVQGDAMRCVGDMRRRTFEGAILVDTPEVYTRERLVNDRFREDKWLTDVLDKHSFTLDLSSRLQGTDDSRRTVAASLEPTTGGAAAGNGATPDQTIPRSSDRIGSRPAQEFYDLAELRRSVRDELLENQLDDRHDIGANTLLRLKFDASIIPQEGGTGWALVVVDVLPYCGNGSDGDPACEGAADRIYTEWLRDTQDRVSLALESSEALLSDRARERRSLVTNGIRLARDALETIVHEKAYIGRRFQEQVRSRTSSLAEARRLHSECQQSQGRSTSNVCNRVFSDPRVRQAPSPDDWLYDSFDAAIDMVAEELNALCKNGERVASGPRAPIFPILEESFTGDGSNISLGGCSTSRIDGKTVRNWVMTSLLIQELRASAIRNLAKFQAVDCGTGRCQVRVLSEQGLESAGGGFFDASDSLTAPTAFLGQLKSSSFVFSYAITPKTAAARVRRRSEELRTLNAKLTTLLATPATGTANALTVSDALQRDLTAIASVPLVVGFSDEWKDDRESSGETSSEDESQTRFGWFIGPEFTGEGARRNAQQGKQVSLSALVSIPGWWNAIGLSVRHCWVSDVGGRADVEKCGRGDTTQSTWLKVPFDAGAASRAFDFIIPRSPFVIPSSASNTGNAEGAELRTGHAGSLVIEGQRLWRSTTVTLGAQTADWIEVLPNMQGIVAHFDCIAEPSSFRQKFVPAPARPGAPADPGTISEVSYSVPVTVWTSEGKDDAPQARVRVTDPTKAKCDPERPGPVEPTKTPASAVDLRTEAVTAKSEG
jgi:hypothetical protein